MFDLVILGDESIKKLWMPLSQRKKEEAYLNNTMEESYKVLEINHSVHSNESFKIKSVWRVI